MHALQRKHFCRMSGRSYTTPDGLCCRYGSGHDHPRQGSPPSLAPQRSLPDLYVSNPTNLQCFCVVLSLHLLFIAAHCNNIDFAVQGGPAGMGVGGRSLDSAHNSFPNLGGRLTGSAVNSVPTPAFSPFQALQVLHSASHSLLLF